MIGMNVQLMQNPMGVGLAVLMGLVILTFVLWYGFFVIALPFAAAISFVRDMVVHPWGKETSGSTTCKERVPVFNPQLGVTMADGGDAIHKEKKG